MKRVAGIAISFAAAFILQAGCTGMFPIMGASANLLLCVTAVLTFMYHENYSCIVFAALFGLLYDICFIQYVGVTPICLVLVGFACIMFRSYVLNYESVISGACIVIGSVLVYYHMFWAILWVCGDRHVYGTMIERMPAYLAINFVFMMAMYIVVQRMLKRAAEPQERRRWY